jgi:cystathionine beta-lyase
MFCEEHQINIISDEIWADFTFRGHSHIPLQSVNAYMKQHTIACYAPTKTFNLGGLQVAYSIIYNNSLMEAYRKISEQSHYNLLNALSLEALVAGYQEGADWVDNLCHYVEENVDYAYTYIREKLPEIKVIKPQGTYLLWLNLKSYGADFVHILELLASKGLVPDDGRKYGVDNFIRLNLACPREMVKLAMKQLEESLR